MAGHDTEAAPRAAAGLIGALTLIAFWITLALSEPAPPSRFTLAGGLASSS